MKVSKSEVCRKGLIRPDGANSLYRDEISSAWDARAQVMLEAPE